MAGGDEKLFVLAPLNFKGRKTRFPVKSSFATEEVEKYDPLIFCRTCANMDSCLVPIFKEEGLDYSLNKKIEKYLPIQVSEEDDLPVHLCYHCASTLIAWDNLLLGCVEAERKLTLLKNSLEDKSSKQGAEDVDSLTNENLDSDDEPLIIKKESRKVKSTDERRDVLQEKNVLQTSESVEIQSERRPKRKISRQKNGKISPRDVETNATRDENSKDSKNECLECGENALHSKKHRRSERGADSVGHRCPICRSSCPDLVLFSEHLYSHLIHELAEGSDVWDRSVCKVCKTSCEGLEQLPDHILRHVNVKKLKSDGRTNVGPKRRTGGRDEVCKLTCEVCGKRISKKYALKRHLATHSGEKKFTCHHCGKQYAQESGLQRHVLVIHEGVRKYKCPICSGVFGSNAELKSHQDTHSDPRPFQCDQCGRTFISQKHLYHHRKYHHTANGMRKLCNVCNRYFSSPSVLKRHHKVVHLGLKEFQCHVCSAQLSTKHYLQEHLRLHSDERPEVCTFCGKTFQVMGNLRQHLKTHLGKTQICYVCGKGFTRRCHLLIHVGSHRGLEHPRCEHCDQVFLLKSDLEKHMKKQHGEKVSDVSGGDAWKMTTSSDDCAGRRPSTDSAPNLSSKEERKLSFVLPPDPSDEFSDNLEDSDVGLESKYSGFEDLDSVKDEGERKAEAEATASASKEKRFFKCDACKKVFNRRFNFERHLLVHSGETLTCQACGKQYRRRSVLDRHVKVVHQQMRLASLCCNYCSKAFSSTQSLEDHFRTHTGERPFICEVCGKDFRARSNLIAHKKIHTGELPFACSLCDYRCRLKSTFVDHCQRHEGTRTCLCSVCGKGFVNKYDLMKHKKTHSKERRFSCSFCGLTFVVKRYLKVHLKTHAQKLEGPSQANRLEDEGENEAHRGDVPAEASGDSDVEAVGSGQDCEGDWDLIPNSWLNIISCKYCGKISCAPKHLRQHERRGTCTKNFQCKDCGQSFAKETNLLKHAKRHQKEESVDRGKRFSCRICNKKFKFEDNGLAHEKICGKAGSVHKCSVCGKRFETKGLADQHWTSHHKSCVCHMCGHSFGKSESLKQHVKTVHEEFKMVCHYCGKEFSRKARLQEHLQRHTGQMDFTCHVCGKGSTNAYSFGVHLATHSQETPFTCSFCPRTFKHMKYVYLHERSVHLKLKSGKTYVKPKKPGKNVAQRTCPSCNKTFKRESAMLIHKRSVHEGKNGYVCKLCGKDFKYTYLLYVHKKKHHFPELCKYICEYCEKPFPVKTELQNHMRKHTGEKPYVCGVCGKTYSFHGSLNMHMKTQHENKKNFKCTICGSSYNFQSHLARHMSVHAHKYPEPSTADPGQN